ncbi:hypothetical protein AVEN_49559-1, partial [Araneus ventricosus]
MNVLYIRHPKYFVLSLQSLVHESLHFDLTPPLDVRDACHVPCFSVETAGSGPQLKAIATMSVGYDHIDTKTCKEKNIPVSNTPDVSTDSVAEMTVTLLLAAGRRLIDAAKAIK